MKQLILILIVFMGVSCTFFKEIGITKKEPFDAVIDKEWHKKIERSKQEVKSAWLSSMSPQTILTALVNIPEYDLLRSEKDLIQTELIPVESFQLKESEVSKLGTNVNAPIESMLSLNKERAVFYVVKDKKFYYSVTSRCINDKWRWGGTGFLDERFCKTLSVLYYKKHIKLYLIELRSRVFFVYNMNGKLWELKYGGISLPFKEELLECAKNMGLIPK